MAGLAEIYRMQPQGTIVAEDPLLVLLLRADVVKETAVNDAESSSHHCMREQRSEGIREMDGKKEIMDMLREIRPEFHFDESDDFIGDGLLDSFDIISLTSMLEEKYRITVDGLDIVPENFTDAEAILALVRRSGGTV